MLKCADAVAIEAELAVEKFRIDHLAERAICEYPESGSLAAPFLQRSAAMIQVKCKKFLGGAAFGLDTRTPPRQVMRRDVQSPRDHDFWGRTRFLKPGLKAEAGPRHGRVLPR